ncbi:DUF1016 N-terminal domain-containing protein [Mucilaginibacter sp. UYCu711]|uniref:DUF1016 N-terminal domain-containing protein n=1 Tax=Mucilaginibacter sp. UYCu711 TaxID=3156339 RepID=UPI003D1A7F27
MGPINNDKLFRSVRELIENARTQVVRNVNTTMLYTNYTISQMIVEEEQQGSDRAGYAETVVKDLNISLTATYGKGFSKRNLDYFKQFYLCYRERIVQTLFAQFERKAEGLPLASVLTVFAEQFKVGWSHYLLLMKVDQVNLKYDRNHITLTKIPVNGMNMKAGFLLLCTESILMSIRFNGFNAERIIQRTKANKAGYYKYGSNN